MTDRKPADSASDRKGVNDGTANDAAQESVDMGHSDDPKAPGHKDDERGPKKPPVTDTNA